MIKLVANAVDRGIEVRKLIKKLQAELKEIEAFLESTGLKAEHTDLKDADREGRRWLAHGSELIVPVIFTADKIVGSFTRDTELHRKIEAASCRRLGAFFKAINGYKNKFDDGKKFRAAAEETLGKESAPPFITACLARDKHGVPLSDVKILWDETEVAV